MVKDFFKVLRFGTLEELTDALNFYLSQGWFVEEMGEQRTEFFQEHVALLVNEDYLKHRKKYYKYFQEDKEHKDFGLLLRARKSIK